MSRVTRGLVATCALLIACGPPAATSTTDGGGADSGPTVPHELSYIEITPANSIIELDLGTPGTQTFQVVGRFLDGVDEDLTQQVTWELDNPAVGALTANTLEIPARAATGVDVGRVTVRLNAFEAQAQVTVVAYQQTGANPDFFFVLPYQPPTGPVMKPLEFGTAVPSMDVFFLTDTTGSMQSEITNLKTSLSNTIVPGIQGVVPDTYFGAGSFEDFPVAPYGNSGAGDQPLRVLQNITNNVPAVQSGINMLTLRNGQDIPESGFEAIYQLITGEGLTSPSPTSVAATNVGFRPDAMPVVVTVSDAMMHEPNGTQSCTFFYPPTNRFETINNYYDPAVLPTAHTRAQTKAALTNKCARSVGVATDAGFGEACGAKADLEDLATTTGARVPPGAWDIGTRPNGCGATQCCTGINGTGRAPDANGLCPLVFIADGNGTGLSTNIVTGIQMLARFAQFDVNTEKSGPSTDVNGVALPSPHTTADFIKEILTAGFTLPAAPPIVPDPTFDTVSFFGVTPATRVKFDVRALNDFLPQTSEAQIFRATIRVLASGCTPLDQREVLILVPPQPLSIQ